MPIIIPTTWQSIFNKILAVEPKAILGGGALRDLDSGRPIKDLDIFIPASAYTRSMVVQALGNPEILKEVSDQYFEWDTAVSNVIELEATEECCVPINLIELRHYSCTVAEQMERFDFGICQIMMDANGIHMSEAYKTDKANKTFTLTRQCTEEQHEHSLARFQRLQEKYEGWTLVEPHGWPLIAEPVNFDIFGAIE